MPWRDYVRLLNVLEEVGHSRVWVRLGLTSRRRDNLAPTGGDEVSRGMRRAEAQTHLEAHVGTLLGEVGPDDSVSPRQMATAIRDAEALLSRAARRALGARSDGRYHPLAATKTVVRSRNAS